MSVAVPADDDVIVAHQLGRRPRRPYRVLRRCPYGHPQVIVSPPVLQDGERFPTWAWLTCPHLRKMVGHEESAGRCAAFARRATSDPGFAARLRIVDERVREARGREAGGEDATPHCGLAGQRDPLGVKCLHAHVAYALAGLGDPIGEEVLASVGDRCAERSCARSAGLVSEVPG